MLVQRDWTDNPELFGFVADALDTAADEVGVRVSAFDERDGYGSHGYITITDPDGRRFRVQLVEEL